MSLQTKKIMFLGTGSDVGKSVVSTAFCRIFKNKGFNVAPFKAQNMSNNSYVTFEGGEIGRAQAVQAEAAGLIPSVNMNPILLKPSSEMGAQVIVCGKVYKNMSARLYYDFKAEMKEQVLQSFNNLTNIHDVIVMEGAGSCCEVNLRQNDIVNFDMALSVNAPVIIIADIDRGGVFAQIIGTMELISEKERNLVAGFIINKFRGDPSLFDDGITYIEQKTKKPVLGLVPFYQGIHIDMEDSMSLETSRSQTIPSKEGIHIAVVLLKHISNFTDIQALDSEPDVNVKWLESPENLLDFDAVIIPGSKSVIHDMLQLDSSGWTGALRTYAEKKRGMIIGLCGGFQILGKEIRDPLNLEGGHKTAKGLGLLDVITELESTKTVKRSDGKDKLFNANVSGYEIHMGKTALGVEAIPFVYIDGNPDGAISRDGMVFGTYLHGLFDSGEFRQQFLEKIASDNQLAMNPNIKRLDFWNFKEENYNLLADHFLRYTKVKEIINIMETHQ
ncbi:MAG: cobyric acid synthase [Desulfobacterales bacterium]|nr:cobyric acid synthase [Desulfobacterales bacterium]